MRPSSGEVPVAYAWWVSDYGRHAYSANDAAEALTPGLLRRGADGTPRPARPAGTPMTISSDQPAASP